MRLPPTMRGRIERLAKSEGVSLNQFIAMTLAEKLGASAEREYFAGTMQISKLYAKRCAAMGASPRAPVTNCQRGENAKYLAKHVPLKIAPRKRK
mgnify:CR=1 FL=1